MKTILIVDDDDSFQYLCEAVLRRSRNEYEVLKAYDGVEALEVLRDREQFPDVILLDINMPRMNGHEFLAEYAKLTPGEIPVVAMLTSSDQMKDRIGAMSYPFVKDYLVKPFRLEDLERLHFVYQDLIALESVNAD